MSISKTLHQVWTGPCHVSCLEKGIDRYQNSAVAAAYILIVKRRANKKCTF